MEGLVSIVAAKEEADFMAAWNIFSRSAKPIQIDVFGKFKTGETFRRKIALGRIRVSGTCCRSKLDNICVHVRSTCRGGWNGGGPVTKSELRYISRYPTDLISCKMQHNQH